VTRASHDNVKAIRRPGRLWVQREMLDGQWRNRRAFHESTPRHFAHWLPPLAPFFTQTALKRACQK
jgi:hypothetical protein